jgi:hypothetical protein
VLLPVDNNLTSLAVRHGVIYTRYVDDFCISSNKAVGFFLRHVREQVARYGLHLAREKTKFGGSRRSATVTGIVLAKRPSVSALYLKRFRELVDRVAGGHLQLTADEYRRVQGSLAWIGRCHPGEAKRLVRRLQSSIPRRASRSATQGNCVGSDACDHAPFGR